MLIQISDLINVCIYTGIIKEDALRQIREEMEQRYKSSSTMQEQSPVVLTRHSELTPDIAAFDSSFTGLVRHQQLDRWAQLSPVGVFDVLECRASPAIAASARSPVAASCHNDAASGEVAQGAREKGATGAGEGGFGTALWSWWTGVATRDGEKKNAGGALVGYSFAVELEQAHWIVRVLVDDQVVSQQVMEITATEMLLSHMEAAHKRNQEKGEFDLKQIMTAQ